MKWWNGMINHPITEKNEGNGHSGMVERRQHVNGTEWHRRTEIRDREWHTQQVGRNRMEQMEWSGRPTGGV